MLITEATAEEIAALKARLQRKRFDRLAEAEMDEVVRMVQKHPLAFAPKTVKANEDMAHIMDALIMLALSSFGALYWNITGNGYGLVMFFACFVSLIIYFRRIEKCQKK